MITIWKLHKGMAIHFKFLSGQQNLNLHLSHPLLQTVTTSLSLSLIWMRDVCRMATDTCSDVYNEHEEYLLDMAPKSCQDDAEKGKRTCRLFFLNFFKHFVEMAPTSWRIILRR